MSSIQAMDEDQVSSRNSVDGLVKLYKAIVTLGRTSLVRMSGVVPN